MKCGKSGAVDKAKLEKERQHYEKAISLNPGSFELHNDLGLVLEKLGCLEAACREYYNALKLKPDYTTAHFNLGNFFKNLGQFKAASKHYQKVLWLKPNYFGVYNNFANMLKKQGKLDEAIKHYKKAVKLKPNLASVQSNLLLCLNYSTEYDAESIFNEHLNWGKSQSFLSDNIVFYPNLPDLDRSLRIGYVSPDFREHPVAYFFEPVIANHDPKTIETVCYAEVSNPDSATERFMIYADIWRNTCNMTDQELANIIRKDGVDILVDLAGHTANNRLPVFARKPAPVQATYLGYPNTTGLSAVDYRITDYYADPPGKTEKFHTEQLIRLPNCFFCYNPPFENIQVTCLPALKNGYITFGSFQNFEKMNIHVLKLWIEILKIIAGSRLILQAKSFSDKKICLKIKEFFKHSGISTDRLELIAYAPFFEYLKLHSKIDIMLDTFPWNGHTTSCHALWMGIPIITLAGANHASRLGLSILTCSKLKVWIAQEPEEYVQKAVQLSGDIENLSVIRQNLRHYITSSPLCDGKSFTLALEKIYRIMWQQSTIVGWGGNPNNNC
ncbi:protein O-GlcNAc transferase [Candidatus Magnetomoraceae bacterium gMMP-15]